MTHSHIPQQSPTDIPPSVSELPSHASVTPNTSHNSISIICATSGATLTTPHIESSKSCLVKLTEPILKKNYFNIANMSFTEYVAKETLHALMEMDIPDILQILSYPSGHSYVTLQDVAALRNIEDIVSGTNLYSNEEILLRNVLKNVENSRWVMVSFRDPEDCIEEDFIEALLTECTDATRIKHKLADVQKDLPTRIATFVFSLKLDVFVERLMNPEVQERMEKAIKRRMLEVFESRLQLSDGQLETSRCSSVKEFEEQFLDKNLQLLVAKFPEMRRVEKQHLRQNMVLSANRAARAYPLQTAEPSNETLKQFHEILSSGDNVTNMKPLYTYSGGQVVNGYNCYIEFGPDNIFFDNNVRIMSTKQETQKAAQLAAVYVALFYVLHEIGVTVELRHWGITEEMVKKYGRIIIVGKPLDCQTRPRRAQVSNIRKRSPAKEPHNEHKKRRVREESQSPPRPSVRSPSSKVHPKCPQAPPSQERSRIYEGMEIHISGLPLARSMPELKQLQSDLTDMCEKHGRTHYIYIDMTDAHVLFDSLSSARDAIQGLNNYIFRNSSILKVERHDKKYPPLHEVLASGSLRLQDLRQYTDSRMQDCIQFCRMFDGGLRDGDVLDRALGLFEVFFSNSQSMEACYRHCSEKSNRYMIVARKKKSKSSSRSSKNGSESSKDASKEASQQCVKPIQPPAPPQDDLFF